MATDAPSRLLYLSPSTLPSRTANSVHVVHQCEGFSRIGTDVTLVAKRSMAESAHLPAAVRDAYGVAFDRVTLETFFRRGRRGDILLLGGYAWAVSERRLRHSASLILSRNLYASYLLAAMRGKPLIHEVHELESGLRHRMLRAIITNPLVITILISESLRTLLMEKGACPRNSLILHDAAPEGIQPLPREAKRSTLQTLVEGVNLDRFAFVCGYFGHLYPGRGIEVIERLAENRPQMGFLVFGGNEVDIAARRAGNRLDNLIFMGFVPHAVAQQAMAACDALLMPYQRRVSIGAGDRDTARWMSPMKMFEYLASGTPVISSDLPVLREVLRHGSNALLAAPDSSDAWLHHLDALAADAELQQRLGAAGHADYAGNHTWATRARRIQAAAAALR